MLQGGGVAAAPFVVERLLTERAVHGPQADRAALAAFLSVTDMQSAATTPLSRETALLADILRVGHAVSVGHGH
jgi:hypothetical protein